MPKTRVVKELDQIQAVVGRYLKPLGFKVKGRTFNRPTIDGLVQVINFQKDRYGDRFAVNVGVYIPEVAKHMDNEAVGTWVQEYHCNVRARLGPTGIDGNDMWWVVRDPETVGSQLSARMENQCVPYLDQHSTRDMILIALEHRVVEGGAFGAPRLISAIIHNGKVEKQRARELLEEQLQLSQTRAHEDYVRELAAELGVTL